MKRIKWEGEHLLRNIRDSFFYRLSRERIMPTGLEKVVFVFNRRYRQECLSGASDVGDVAGKVGVEGIMWPEI